MTTADRVAAAITPRTKLIVPVHFAGASLDLQPLRELAAAKGIPLVEDAAHAAGTEYRGKPTGSGGTSIYSFHPIKNLTTGEGGLVTTDDGELAARLRRLRFHGLGADAFQRDTQGRAPQAEVIEPGFKYNLPDMNAALGVSQLARLAEMNRKRAALAARYAELLAGVEGVLPLGLPKYRAAACVAPLHRARRSRRGRAHARRVHGAPQRPRHRHRPAFPRRAHAQVLPRALPAAHAVAEYGMELGPRVLVAAVPGHAAR